MSIETINPTTGEKIKSYKEMSQDEVHQVMESHVDDAGVRFLVRARRPSDQIREGVPRVHAGACFCLSGGHLAEVVRLQAREHRIRKGRPHDEERIFVDVPLTRPAALDV